MGLKFRIFTKAEHNSMSSPAAALRKAAAASSAKKAAASAPPHPASSVGGGGQQAGSDKRGARGKGGGNPQLTEAQIAAIDAKARLQAEEAELKLLEVKAKKAEAQARIDKANSGASSAQVVSTPRAQGGRGGGDFVTHDQFQAGINDLNGAITKGFGQVFSNQRIAAEQQALTNATLAGFVRMMGTNGTELSLPAPVSRQIGNGRAQEVPEPQHSQSGAACGDGSAQEFHRESVQSSAKCSTAVMSNFDEAVHKWNTNPKNSQNNGRIIAVIQRLTADVDMKCILLALVNGKTLTEIVRIYGEDVASLLSTGNTPFFQNFFGALSRCGLPSNFDVKIDSSKTKSGNSFCMTYLQLSQAPGNVDKLVTFLRKE
jgi:hypothetical protein